MSKLVSEVDGSPFSFPQPYGVLQKMNIKSVHHFVTNSFKWISIKGLLKVSKMGETCESFLDAVIFFFKLHLLLDL